MGAEKVTSIVPFQQQHQMALEPMSINEAFEIAKMACQSGLLPRAITRPEQAMMVLMRGRELGLTAMQSFASIHVIEGKTSLSAELIVGLVKRSPLCKYFRFVSGDDTQATFETLREGNPQPTRLTFTAQQAGDMGLLNKDNWKKQRGNMLRWRCAVALARLEYSEVTIGLVSPDEAEDIESARDVTPAPQLVTEPVRIREEADEPIEAAMGRWRNELFTSATIAECDRVRRQVKARLTVGSSQYEAMVALYKTRVKELKTAHERPAKQPEPLLPPPDGEFVDGREPGADDDA
jgi:hypothetical protein